MQMSGTGKFTNISHLPEQNKYKQQQKQSVI